MNDYKLKAGPCYTEFDKLTTAKYEQHHNNKTHVIHILGSLKLSFAGSNFLNKFSLNFPNTETLPVKQVSAYLRRHFRQLSQTINSALTDKAERNCHIPVPGSGCMTHRQTLYGFFQIRVKCLPIKTT